MRRYYSFIIFLLCQTWVLNGWGQQKLVLEQIQVYSSINPSASYWKLPSDITPIIKAIDSGILLKMGLPRDTNIVTKAGFPTKFVESITCGIPVLTNKNSNIEELSNFHPFLLAHNMYKGLF